MRKSLLSLVLLGIAAGCSAPSGPTLEQFSKPNPLLRKEIERRISQIPFQHGQELLMTLCWLQKRGEQAVPALVKALDHENAKMRSNAIWVIGRIKDSRAVPFVQACLDDAHPVVALETAYALLTMGSDAGVKVLIQGLESQDARYRYRCAAALQDWSGKNFAYDHTRKVEANRTAINKWQAWWNETSGKAVFQAPETSSANLAAPPTPQDN